MRAHGPAALLAALLLHGGPGLPPACAADAPARPPTAAPATAWRIVSLQPSLTETLCALDACDRLVGIDRYADWPASVQRLPRLGGLADADIERIVATRPDLVLLRPRNRAAERLRELGLNVLALDARSHADMRRNMETVAQAIGRPGAGEALWARTDARLEALRGQLPAHWQGKRVYFELHGGVAAAGEASFIGETLARLGLRNVVPAQLGAFPKLGPEYALRADPDLLIVHDMPGAPPLQARPGWHAMRAVREGRACRIAEPRFDVLVRPGPRLDEAAQHILACLAAVDRQLAGAR
ncbi:ABC transporter substrate-binding protein [Pseudorhodoferax soli]|uniref:Iron complex transport system substrate-binding protein n=1 Tax=Pseudorhodoferax soli TaxID=545864 RepID=A0A368X7E7_9BURK|nr:helical backbone metal receptor [Pseudorhodoferax soli]RCW63116.1 iron complex transport system substrate-binding protein [Pseudorhodoferax soli]